MKNPIKTFIESISRFFNRKEHWEEALDDWDDVTEPIVYVEEYDLSPLPNNVIYASQRFTKGVK